MRKIALTAAALLAACSTAPAARLIHGVTPGHTCQDAGSEQFVGRAKTSKSKGAILRASHAAVLRWAPPGVMLTMDFRADRVTVWLGPDNKITKVRCG
jgi:hypothetical protein